MLVFWAAIAHSASILGCHVTVVLVLILIRPLCWRCKGWKPWNTQYTHHTNSRTQEALPKCHETCNSRARHWVHCGSPDCVDFHIRLRFTADSKPRGDCGSKQKHLRVWPETYQPTLVLLHPELSCTSDSFTENHDRHTFVPEPNIHSTNITERVQSITPKSMFYAQLSRDSVKLLEQTTT